MEHSLQQRWRDYQLTKTQAFWLAVGCILATLILGFGPGGWVTAGTAAKNASEAALSSRRELAVAVCVDQFMHAKDASAQLAKIKQAGWYDRGGLITAGGWATMPDKAAPNSSVATMCASKVAEQSEVGGVKRTSTN